MLWVPGVLKQLITGFSSMKTTFLDTQEFVCFGPLQSLSYWCWMCYSDFVILKICLDTSPALRGTYVSFILSVCPCGYICLTNCFVLEQCSVPLLRFLNGKAFCLLARICSDVTILHFHPRSFYCKTVSLLRAAWWHILSWQHFYVVDENPWQPWSQLPVPQSH